MRTFDVETWKKRALARYKKRVLKSKQHAIKQLANENQSIDSLKRLIDWCAARSQRVCFKRIVGGEYNCDTKVFTINANSTPENQMFILLHEIGHYMIKTCGTSRSKSSFGYQFNEHDVDLTFHYRVDLLEEEYEAWDRGRKHAKRLKINIDHANYDKFKINSIKTYIMWAAKKIS